MNVIDEIVKYESGEMDRDQVVDLFQTLVNCGLVWKLQGSYGRTAAQLIQSGEVALPVVTSAAARKLPN